MCAAFTFLHYNWKQSSAWWRWCLWWDILYIKSWGSYHFQLFKKRILRSSLFWRFGHVKVQRVPIPHSVQTQHKSNIVLQQTGVWKGEYNNFIESWHKKKKSSRVDTISKHCSSLADSTCMVQIVLQPAFGALVVELSSPRHKEQQVVPEDNTIRSDLQ